MDDLIEARDELMQRAWSLVCQTYADGHDPRRDNRLELRCRGMRLLAPVLAAYVSLEDEVRRLAEEE